MLSPSQSQDQNLHLHRLQGGPVNMTIKWYCSKTTELWHLPHPPRPHSSAGSPQPMPNNGGVKQGVQRKGLECDDNNDKDKRSQSERQRNKIQGPTMCQRGQVCKMWLEMDRECSGFVLQLHSEIGWADVPQVFCGWISTISPSESPPSGLPSVHHGCERQTDGSWSWGSMSSAGGFSLLPYAPP